MTAYKKQLLDKDGNVIYPDVGINLDDVVYSDDPTTATDIIDPSSYSTSEKWTGGYWINNEKIYKKTVDIGNLPNSTSKSVAHDISNLSTLVKIEGAVKSSTGFLPLPTTLTAVANQVGVTVDSTNINLYTGIDRSNYSGYITLYYTKTTT